MNFTTFFISWLGQVMRMYTVFVETDDLVQYMQ